MMDEIKLTIPEGTPKTLALLSQSLLDEITFFALPTADANALTTALNKILTERNPFKIATQEIHFSTLIQTIKGKIPKNGPFQSLLEDKLQLFLQRKNLKNTQEISAVDSKIKALFLKEAERQAQKDAPIATIDAFKEKLIAHYNQHHTTPLTEAMLINEGNESSTAIQSLNSLKEKLINAQFVTLQQSVPMDTLSLYQKEMHGLIQNTQTIQQEMTQALLSTLPSDEETHRFITQEINDYLSFKTPPDTREAKKIAIEEMLQKYNERALLLTQWHAIVSLTQSIDTLDASQQKIFTAITQPNTIDQRLRLISRRANEAAKKIKTITTTYQYQTLKKNTNEIMLELRQSLIQKGIPKNREFASQILSYTTLTNTTEVRQANKKAVTQALKKAPQEMKDRWALVVSLTMQQENIHRKNPNLAAIEKALTTAKNYLNDTKDKLKPLYEEQLNTTIKNIQDHIFLLRDALLNTLPSAEAPDEPLRNAIMRYIGAHIIGDTKTIEEQNTRINLLIPRDNHPMLSRWALIVSLAKELKRLHGYKQTYFPLLPEDRKDDITLSALESAIPVNAAPIIEKIYKLDESETKENKRLIDEDKKNITALLDLAKSTLAQAKKPEQRFIQIQINTLENLLTIPQTNDETLGVFRARMQERAQLIKTIENAIRAIPTTACNDEPSLSGTSSLPKDPIAEAFLNNIEHLNVYTLSSITTLLESTPLPDLSAADDLTLQRIIQSLTTLQQSVLTQFNTSKNQDYAKAYTTISTSLRTIHTIAQENNTRRALLNNVDSLMTEIDTIAQAVNNEHPITTSFIKEIKRVADPLRIEVEALRQTQAPTIHNIRTILDRLKENRTYLTAQQEEATRALSIVTRNITTIKRVKFEFLKHFRDYLTKHQPQNKPDNLNTLHQNLQSGNNLAPPIWQTIKELETTLSTVSDVKRLTTLTSTISDIPQKIQHEKEWFAFYDLQLSSTLKDIKMLQMNVTHFLNNTRGKEYSEQIKIYTDLSRTAQERESAKTSLDTHLNEDTYPEWAQVKALTAQLERMHEQSEKKLYYPAITEYNEEQLNKITTTLEEAKQTYVAAMHKLYDLPFIKEIDQIIAQARNVMIEDYPGVIKLQLKNQLLNSPIGKVLPTIILPPRLDKSHNKEAQTLYSLKRTFIETLIKLRAEYVTEFQQETPNETKLSLINEKITKVTKELKKPEHQTVLGTIWQSIIEAFQNLKRFAVFGHKPPHQPIPYSQGFTQGFFKNTIPILNPVPEQQDTPSPSSKKSS